MMNKLVFVENNEVVTDSLTIAELFNKEHFNVTRDIESAISNITELKKSNEAKDLGIDFNTLKFEGIEYKDSRNRKQLKYILNFDAFMLVTMGYTTQKAMLIKVKYINEFNRMKEYVQQQFKQSGNNAIEFEKQLIGVKYATEILGVDEPSKVKMLEAAHTQHGVPTNHLPVYVENEELKKPISDLLKEHNVGISAIKANNILIAAGILEIKHRPSSKVGTKAFKSITEKGQYYGSNAISPRNPKETQPLYFPSKFSELIPLLLGQVKEVS